MRLVRKIQGGLQGARETDKSSSYVSVMAQDQDGNGVSQLDVIMKTLKTMQKQIESFSQTDKVPCNVNMSPARSRYADDEEIDEMDKDVEIGTKGSGILVKKRQWMQASAQGTATAMATCLLDAIIPLEILLVSNLRRGAHKIQSAAGVVPQPRYRALDSNIITEIFDTVQKQRSKSFNATMVGKAINDHLNYLRAQKKRNDDLESQLSNLTSPATTSSTSVTKPN